MRKFILPYRNMFIAAALGILFISCGNDSVKPGDDGFTTDTTQRGYTIMPPTGPGTFNSPEAGFSTAEEEERKRKRELLYMGIDSTYYAIGQIELIKSEMSNQSAVNLSASERNLKSKALQQLNLIENTLCRQVDSALLVNLKMHTQQLEKINTDINGKVERLQKLSENLAKAAQVMDRITSVLSICVGKGIIKPATPPSKTAAEVKAAAI